jgi:hypothetical protein
MAVKQVTATEESLSTTLCGNELCGNQNTVAEGIFEVAVRKHAANSDPAAVEASFYIPAISNSHGGRTVTRSLPMAPT